jgi:hypothetical protein
MISMPDPSLEISGASIVLLGAFNPPIFQPEWFARQELLPQTEVDHAEVAIIQSQVAQFQTERFDFQITPDRLVIAAKPNTVSEPLRDLVVGIFYVLEHTPVQAMGMNRQMHFAMPSEKAWHLLGDRLAPKEPWSEFANGRRPGLRNLQILYGSISSQEPSTTVTVQPSLQISYGAYFEVNDHSPAEKGKGVNSLMDILQSRWEESQNNAERIAKHILGWAAAES